MARKNPTAGDPAEIARNASDALRLLNDNTFIKAYDSVYNALISRIEKLDLVSSDHPERQSMIAVMELKAHLNVKRRLVNAVKAGDMLAAQAPNDDEGNEQ